MSLAAPKELVLGWLRPGMKLLNQNLTPEGLHPVTLLLGIEDAVYPSWAPFFKMNYQEFAVVIPFVGLEEPGNRFPGPYLFTPHIYIDQALPIWIGRFFFGFAKADADMSWNRERIEITRNGPIFRADFGWTGRSLSADTRAVVEAVLQQPSVSEQRPGRLVGSGFNWSFSNAKLEEMETDLAVKQPFLPGIDTLLDGRKGKGDGDLQRGFSFLIETRWTLGAPLSLSHDWGAYVSEAARSRLVG